MNVQQIRRKHYEVYGTGFVVGVRDVQQLLRDAERLSLPADMSALKRNLDGALDYFRAVSSEGLGRKWVEATYVSMYQGLLSRIRNKGWIVRVEGGSHIIECEEVDTLEGLCGLG